MPKVWGQWHFDIAISASKETSLRSLQGPRFGEGACIMTAQLDVEALVGRARNSADRCLERAQGYGALRQSSLTAITLDHAAHDIAALLAHIAGEDARVAAAVAGERERCAQLAERLSGDDATNRALNEQICCSGVDCGCMGSTVGSYLEWHLANAIRNPAIRETPSA